MIYQPERISLIKIQLNTQIQLIGRVNTAIFTCSETEIADDAEIVAVLWFFGVNEGKPKEVDSRGMPSDTESGQSEEFCEKQDIMFDFPAGWQLRSIEDSMKAIIDYRGKTPRKTLSGKSR